MGGRDFRIVNMSEGQKVESDKVLKRIGEVSYRDIGILARIGLFNSGKALITEGLRVVASSGMTVSIPAGMMLQRIPSGDILPCIAIAGQTLTLDSASGVARVDMIECQVKSVIDKNDSAGSVLDSSTGAISLAYIKRDIKYYLAIQKKTGSVTATSATAGKLTGTVAIAGTINLSSKYLINIADGEDGSFIEIDLRGVTPEATTRAEIIAKINSAVGRTMAGTGTGNVVELTGFGTGITSYFEFKPPVTNSDADAIQTVFGLTGSGVYNYIYQGVNDWIKLCEIDVGTVTTTITDVMIRNIDEKTTWASDSANIKTRSLVYDSDPINPVGVISPLLSGYFANNANGTYTAVAQTLPASWKVCDGSALDDPESPIFNGAGRYLPNLTDSRFIMGSTVALSGTIGGNTNNTFTLTSTQIPSHTHSVSHTHPIGGSTGTESATHSHNQSGGDVYSALAQFGEFSRTATGSAESGGGYSRAMGYVTGGANSTHTHTLPADTATSSITDTGSYGSGTAFSILPKYLTCAYIMKIK